MWQSDIFLKVHYLRGRKPGYNRALSAHTESSLWIFKLSYIELMNTVSYSKSTSLVIIKTFGVGFIDQHNGLLVLY